MSVNNNSNKQKQPVDSTNQSATTTATTVPAVLTRVQKKIQPVLDSAKTIVIHTNDQYLQAGEQRQVIKGLLKEVDELLDPIVKAAHDTHKMALEQKRKVTGPLEDADKRLSLARGMWSQAQERLRLEEEKKLREVEEAREAARVEEEARVLAESGDVDGAMALLDEPSEVVSVKVESFVPKQEGLSDRTTWSAVVLDMRALVAAVAKGDAPIECLSANMVFLNNQARAFRKGLSIAGVRAVGKTSESVRGV